MKKNLRDSNDKNDSSQKSLFVSKNKAVINNSVKKISYRNQII